MKILFLSRYQNKINRGAETFVHELATRLQKKHSIEIFSGKEADSLSSIIKSKSDIVVPINGRLQSLKASFGRVVGGYKILISGHSGIGRDDIWNITIAKPDVFVALTDYMALWAKKWAWGSRVVKIPNGIDLEKFNPVGEKISLDMPKSVILSVGALVWYKYHERIIEAVSNIKNCSLLIVGSGEKEIELRKLGEEKLGKRFKLISAKYEDLPKIYRSADLFTLPSWDREAFGIVYLEAMASGLAVVAPDDPPRREIVGDAGIFVNTDDSAKYAKSLEEALVINWGDKPRKQVEKFSWDLVANEYESVFMDLVRREK